MLAMVSSCIADHFANSVDGSIGCLANQFSLTVSVEVIHHELSVMCPLPNVLAKIDGPQKGAIQFVCMQDWLVGKSTLRVISATAGHVNDDLVLTVTI